MKHVIDTQWVSTPTRERLAATRKRTLRSVAARRARSVWSECQSRVIDSRNSVDRSGLPALCRGDNIAGHTVSRHLRGAQATCTGTGPGAESGAKAYGGILGSWESRLALSYYCRTWTTPAHQRPGTWGRLPAVHVSEMEEATKEPAREGNRSGRGQGGSRSGHIVAFESRVTHRRKPVSSEGGHRGEGVFTWANGAGASARSPFPCLRGIMPPRANSSLQGTGCINCARPGLWGCRRRPRRHYPAGKGNGVAAVGPTRSGQLQIYDLQFSIFNWPARTSAVAGGAGQGTTTPKRTEARWADQPGFGCRRRIRER
jgi:hypothetical protein